MDGTFCEQQIRRTLNLLSSSVLALSLSLSKTYARQTRFCFTGSVQCFSFLTTEQTRAPQNRNAKTNRRLYNDNCTAMYLVQEEQIDYQLRLTVYQINCIYIITYRTVLTRQFVSSHNATSTNKDLPKITRNFVIYTDIYIRLSNMFTYLETFTNMETYLKMCLHI